MIWLADCCSEGSQVSIKQYDVSTRVRELKVFNGF